MKLVKHAKVRGILPSETNTRIGGSKDTLEIGAQDNPVIRNPVTLKPYLPGSSLKGKLRSLLEWSEGKPGSDPCACGKCLICSCFGKNIAARSRGNEQTSLPQPTRFIFRDAALTTDSEAKVGAQSFTKTETAIDRATGAVKSGSLRTQEFVPAGCEFDFEISVRIFEGDKPAEFRKLLEDGFNLLAKEYLGGSGTRGYGKVAIPQDKLEFTDFQ